MSKKISEQDIKQLMKLKPGTSRKAAVEYAKMLADLGMSVKDAIKRAGMKTQYSKNAALSSRTKYKYVPNKPAKKSKKPCKEGKAPLGKSRVLKSGKVSKPYCVKIMTESQKKTIEKLQREAGLKVKPITFFEMKSTSKSQAAQKIKELKRKYKKKKSTKKKSAKK